jgi:hypothetical protein
MSTSAELQSVFSAWVRRVYDEIGAPADQREKAVARLAGLKAYKWNVLEVLPHTFFETYILADWGHAFTDRKVMGAKAGYCDGMRNHFAVLYDGRVTLCCIDFDGETAVGDAGEQTLSTILESPHLGRIMDDFQRYRLRHPHCQRCLGSTTPWGAAAKPLVSILGMHLLRPYFYHQKRLFDAGA